MSESQKHITGEYYDQVRQQIEHEDNLITQRLAWLMASQSFLFSAYAIILSGLNQGESSSPLEIVRFNFFRFLPVAGFISTGLIYASICGGILSIVRLRKLWDSLGVPAISLNRPPVHSSRLVFILGQSAPRLLPPALLGMWVYLFLRSCLEVGR